MVWLTTTLGGSWSRIFVPVITFLVLWQGFHLSARYQCPANCHGVLLRLSGAWVGWRLLYWSPTGWWNSCPGNGRAGCNRLSLSARPGDPGLVSGHPNLAHPVSQFQDATGHDFVGLSNYIFAFTDRIMLEAFRNNLLWMIFGTSFSVGLGLMIAVLADRIRFENVYKASFSCRWRFRLSAQA